MKNKTEKEFESLMKFNFKIKIPFHKVFGIFKKKKSKDAIK